MVFALILSVAWSQDYAFPTSADDYAHYYPTAYKDHAGVDWNCGSIRYAGHQGSDFGAGSFYGMDAGRDVTAAAEGTVVTTHDGEFDRCTTGDCAGGYGFGNYVKIAHDDGRITLYGHLKQWSLLVGVGDRVSCGQKLGEMGSSGYSTGPHVHFEVRNSSEVAEDPFDGPCSAPPTYWVDQGPYDGLPGNVCGEPPVCEPEATLGCGDVVVGRNDDAGSTTATWQYGCDEFVYTGPERSFTVVTGIDEPVTVSLTGLDADLDLMALASPACDGSDCILSSSNPDISDEQLTYDGLAGVETTVVVDGWEGAVSPFVLTVDCVGGGDDTGVVAPTPTGSDTTATGDTGLATTPTDPTPPGPTGDDDVDDTDELPEGERPDVATQQLAPAPSGGCGCATGSDGGAWLLGLAALGLGRRRWR